MNTQKKFSSSTLFLFGKLVRIKLIDSLTDRRVIYTGLGFLYLFPAINGQAQTGQDTLKTDKKWAIHFQSTSITQYHPSFRADYSGPNSLDQSPELRTSASATLFIGARLWKGAEAYFNQELTGGEGFSHTMGIAGFPNGETYRVSETSPKTYVARFYLKQIFSLSDDYIKRTVDFNQISSRVSKSYIAIIAGKFSIMDFFDDNSLSHDPRTQFFNWALMGNGAWDYPANTQGYTSGLVLEYVWPAYAIRLSSVMVPTTANGNTMDGDILHAHSSAIELEHQYAIGNQTGTIRLMTYLTKARMGNYREAINQSVSNQTTPQVDSTRIAGRTKFGLGINMEQPVSATLGTFLRAGWNDGKNETWAFTEIDRHISAGVVLDGLLWNRKGDKAGIAQVINGLSKDHREYLGAGGLGFMLGDGQLNYGPECITEFYYSLRLFRNNLFLSPDYQFIEHPAYNRDRGPVNSIGARIHLEI